MSYLTHTACDIEKVPKRALKDVEGVEDLLQQYIVQMKFDGICLVMRVAGDHIDFFTRTGEQVTTLDHIADAFRALPYDMLAGLVRPVGQLGDDEVVDHPTQHRDGVYIGELWHPEFKNSTTSGAAMRDEANDITKKLQFVVCDFITPHEWLQGHSPLGFLDRIEQIAWLQGIYHPDEGGEFKDGMKPKAPPIWFAGHEGTVADQAAVSINDLAKEACDAGNYDGIICRKADGTWTSGARDENIVKVKPHLTLDLTIVGTEPGKGKHAGRIGAILVEYKGKTARVGTGLSDAERERTDLVGKIAEVRAMSESVHGLLREPRLKCIRFDTVPEDEK